MAQLEALGHTKQPLLRVIRTNCIECCAGNEAEVRRCGMHWCPFWPYRMGSNTFHRQELTEAERQERATRAAKLKQGRPTREHLVQKAGEASAGTPDSGQPFIAAKPATRPTCAG